MDPNYRYKGAPLKPKIAKSIILEQFAGKTMSRREIDDGVIQHHQSNGGLPSTAKTNPIKAALRYLKDKGFAENVSRGSGSTWRIFENPEPVSEPSNAQELVAVIRAEIQYLTTQTKSFEHRISDNPLVRKYQPRIYNLIYRHIRNHEAAEDLCQEVFLKAWRALPNFQRRAVFYRWLHQIAVNCSIDFIRKQKRQIVFATEELTINPDDTFQMPQTHPSPDDILEKEELGHIIREAAAQLPPGQHTVFNLRYREELSIKEIASHLNKSESTIKAHLYHARQSLQDMLRPYLKNEPFAAKELTS